MTKKKELGKEEEVYASLVRSVYSMNPAILLTNSLQSPKIDTGQQGLLKSYKSFFDEKGILTPRQRRITNRIYLELHRPKGLKGTQKIKNEKPLKKVEHCHAVRLPDKEFYETKNWKDLRARTLELRRFSCEKCKKHGTEETLNVLHIRSRLLYPELSLSEHNLQFLCADCVPKKPISNTKPILRKQRESKTF